MERRWGLLAARRVELGELGLRPGGVLLPALRRPDLHAVPDPDHDDVALETMTFEDLGDGRHRVPAGLHLDDLGELYGIELDDEEVDTVGGLIGKVTGRVPIVGAHCEVAGLSLTAEKMSGRQHRSATVIVEPVPTEQAHGGREHEEIGA